MLLDISPHLKQVDLGGGHVDPAGRLLPPQLGHPELEPLPGRRVVHGEADHGRTGVPAPTHWRYRLMEKVIYRKLIKNVTM